MKGKINSDQGYLEGVLISYEKDSSINTKSDSNGSFTVPYHEDKGMLIMSKDGYKTAEFKAENSDQNGFYMAKKASFIQKNWLYFVIGIALVLLAIIALKRK